jgi:thioester reductase-like protein
MTIDRTQGVATLVDLLRERAGSARPAGYRWLERGEIDGPTVAWSWADVDRRARAVAARLVDLGMTGERALLLFPPGLDFIAGFFGCLYAGVVAVPAYPPDPTRLAATLPRLSAIVRDARPAVVLTTTAVQALADGLAAVAPDVAVLEALAVDAADPAWGDAWRPPRIDGRTLAFLQYTSGSTASPRGVMLAHDHLLANQRMMGALFDGLSGYAGVSWLPLFHDMGLIGKVLQPLYLDAPMTLFSPLDFLKRPMRWVEAIARTGASHSGGPDFAYALCARKARPEEIAALDLSRWRMAFSGAEPVRADTLDAFARVFAPAGFDPRAFYPTYGLAEATLFVSGGGYREGARVIDCDAEALSAGRLAKTDAAAAPGAARRFVACGRPAIETEIAILRADGSRAAPGEIAEICVRSPAVASGYWDRPEESEATFRFRSSDGDVFLRTGDLGALVDGGLCVAGRAKDVIILRGKKHFPQDIERVVEAAHPSVRAGCVAAFTLPSASGEGLGIAAEIDPGADGAAVEAAVRAAVASAHEIAVDGVALLAPRTIPKTSSGKIQRHAAQRAFLEDALAPVHRAGAPAARPGGLPAWLVDGLCRDGKVARAAIRRDAKLTELGLDSMGIVELAGAMEEHLGVEVPVEVVFGLTLGEIADWIETTALPAALPERPDLEASARLDGSITIAPGAPRGDDVFLTGATGFLGAFLLAELLQRSPRAVICLVRAADPDAGRRRLHDVRGRLGLDVDLDRVEVIPGDLALPLLGLDADAFQALSQRIGRIVHAGARVDWSARFADLSPTNVGGTREIVRLSAAGGGVPVHHVSSLGVFPIGLSARSSFAEEAPLAEGELLRVPYFQSKWAAERLLEHARARGVPVTVYRPGFVTGHSRTGVELDPASQLLCAFIAGAARMGSVPALEKVIDVVPVDFVAAAVAALSLAGDTEGRAYNLLNPRPMRQGDFYAVLREAGFALEPTAFPRWREQVLRLPREDRESPLCRFALYYRTLTPQTMRRLEALLAARLPVEDAAARDRLDREGIHCPPLDARLVRTYLARYVEAGLLPAPAAAATASREAPARASLLDLPALARPFLQGLPEGEQRLMRLYEKAKQRQWDASRRLDWSQDVDPENPEALPDETVPIFASPVWQRLTPRERTEVRRHHQGWQLSQFLAGEQGALLCAGRIVAEAPDAAARLYCSTQVMDEARHVEVFSRLLHQKVGVSYAPSPSLTRLLDDVLHDRRWDVTCLGMQVLVEGMGLAAFSLVRDHSTHPLIAAAHAYVCEDEARHVSFGKSMLTAVYAQLGEAERREREELVVEASYLLRDRFAARELWERLGLPVAACVAWVEDAGFMRRYRAELFRRIVPVVRAIGLWGPRVRDAYARMGVLDYARLDADRIVEEDERIAAGRFAEPRAPHAPRHAPGAFANAPLTEGLP